MTAPAVVSWAAYEKWLNLQGSGLAFMGSATAAFIISAAALVELVMDKLPKTPRRTEVLGLVARIVLGGLSGATLCAAGNQSVVLGSALGTLGGVAGGFAGYGARMRLVKALNVSDFVIAVTEDILAIGCGLLLVTRFQ